jgi:hypothetical protein
MEAYRNGPGMGILNIDAEAERSQHEVILMANAKGKCQPGWKSRHPSQRK